MAKKKFFLYLGLLIGLSFLFFAPEAGASSSGYDQPWNKLSSSLVTPHIPFANPYYKGKIKVLVIAPTWTQRETVEFAERLSLDYTPLMTESYDYFGRPYPGKAKTRYYLTPSPEQFVAVVRQKLSPQANYDLIIIGKIPWKVFPESVRKKILDKVRQGTGLLYISPSGLVGELKTAFKENEKIRDFIIKGVPLEAIPLLKDIPLSRLLRTGNLDRGRIVSIDYGEKGLSAGQKLHRLESLTPFKSNDPLFYDYYYSLLAKAALWASKKEPAISFKGLSTEEMTIARAKLPDTKISFSLVGKALPGQIFYLQYIIRDRQNRVEFNRIKDCRIGREVSLSLPLLKGGEKILDIWLRAGDSRIINWVSIPFKVIPSVRIEKVTLNKDIYQKDGMVKGKVLLSRPITGKLSLRIEAWDNYQREVVSAPPSLNGKEAGFSFQVPNPLTSAYTLRVSLRDKNAVLDERELPFYLNITDFSSLVSDFRFIIWGDAWSKSRSVNTYLKQFVRYGVDILYNISSNWDNYKKSREIALRIARANLKAAPYATRILFADNRYAQLKPILGPDGPEIRNCPLAESPEKLNKSSRIKHIKDIARAYGPLGPAYYSLGDENALAHGSIDVGFGSKCQESFREYLKKVYPELSALNKEWGTDYKNWAGVKAITLIKAYKLNRYPQWIDHRLHMETLYTNYHVACVKAITEIDPEAKVGIEGPTYPNKSYSGFNLYQLLPHFRFFGPYANPISLHATLSFLPPNSLTSSWFGSYAGSTSEETMRYFPWHMLFSGMNSVAWFRSGVAKSRGLGGQAAFSPDYLPLPYFRQAAEEIKEIKSGIGKLLISSKREISPIALYYSNSSLHATTIRARETTWESSLTDFNYVLRDGGYDYRYLSPEDVDSGKLKDYKVLILPYSQAIALADVEKIKAFVRKGGILIADFAPGIMDGHGKMLPQSSLLEVFGKFSRLNIHVYGKGKGVYLGDYIKGYQDKRKKGEAKGISAGIRRLISKLAKVKPFAEIEDSNGEIRQDIEISSFRNGKAIYLTLLRSYGKTAVKVTGPEGGGEGGVTGQESPQVKVQLPAASYIYDVRGNKYLGYKSQFTTSISPAQAKVFALLPAPIKKIELKLDKRKYREGKEVNFVVNLSPAKLKGSGLAVRLEVFGPDKKIIPYYSQNLISNRGRFAGMIPLSLNEPLGIYTIVAKDIVSSLKAKKTFRVK